MLFIYLYHGDLYFRLAEVLLMNVPVILDHQDSII